MSLINDALKRARDAQERNPFGGPPVLPLQPVDCAARSNWIFRTLVGTLVVAALTLSGWFFEKWRRSGNESKGIVAAGDKSPAPTVAEEHVSVTTNRRKQRIQVSTDIVMRTNLVARPLETEPASADAPISVPPSRAAAPVSPTNSLVPALPPSPFADLRLQSIIFREEKPAAVINGEMVFVGDDIHGARVMKIERQSVTVERTGETNELRLPRL
jgi:hypothetical protein